MTKTDFTGEIIFTEPGSMAPIWKNMVEAGKTQVEDRLGWTGEITELFQILYCVDSSAPERIGNATINLVELLHQPSIQSAPVLIVFTKTDLKSARTLNELKSLMRLEDIRQHSNQEINVLEFNTEDESKLGPVLDWCIRFKTVQFQYMNGNAY